MNVPVLSGGKQALRAQLLHQIDVGRVASCPDTPDSAPPKRVFGRAEEVAKARLSPLQVADGSLLVRRAQLQQRVVVRLATRCLTTSAARPD
jgi:hypothetical protein